MRRHRPQAHREAGAAGRHLGGVQLGRHPGGGSAAERRGPPALERPPSRIIIKKFRDGFLPYEGSLVKEAFEELKARCRPI